MDRFDVEQILKDLRDIEPLVNTDTGLLITFTDEFPLTEERLLGLLAMLAQWPEILNVEASRI